jgi:homeobox protein cut-like
MKSQRERFRLRNEELEMENDKHHEQVQLLQGEIQHLKQDNLNLYEKIR